MIAGPVDPAAVERALKERDWTLALRLAARWRSLAPEQPDAWYATALALRGLGRREEAATMLQQLLSRHPGHRDARVLLARLYLAAGAAQQAISEFESALSGATMGADVHLDLGNARLLAGLADAAADSYRQALEINPDHAETLRHLAGVRPEPELVPDVEACLARVPTPTEAMHCHYALGRLFDRSGDYGAAFDHYQRANRIRREQVPHDSRRFSRHVASLMEFFDADYFAGLAHCDDRRAHRPIFIVGLPRSGTTLVERILSSHSSVCAGGEPLSMPQLDSWVGKNLAGGYPQVLRLADSETLRELAARYMEGLGNLAPGTTRKTDKLPGNFLSVGLVRTLFPGAAVIHCRRDPRDACLSMFCNYFAEGNGQSCDLEDLADYCLDYLRLMDHWDAVLDDVISVDYEQLVCDQEGGTRALLSQLDLPWEAACLDFTNNPTAARTASSTQVRQGIYTSSIGRWRHYREQLAPLLERLAQERTAGGRQGDV